MIIIHSMIRAQKEHLKTADVLLCCAIYNYISDKLQLYDSMTDFELVDELSKLGKVKVPNAIEEIRDAKILHNTVCDVDQMENTVRKCCMSINNVSCILIKLFDDLSGFLLTCVISIEIRKLFLHLRC